LAEFSTTIFNQTDGDKYGFTRYALELSQYLTLFRRGRVLAIRLLGETNTRLSDDQDTPFFGRANLGGPTTLRGYSTGRFRDKDLILLNVEYRPISTETLSSMDGFVNGKGADDAHRFFYYKLNTERDGKTSKAVRVYLYYGEQVPDKLKIVRVERDS